MIVQMKSSQPFTKIPPHNLDAEQAVLGGMFINPKCIPKVKKAVVPSDFYRESHQHIARAIFELRLNADLVTVSDLLKSKNLLEKCGGQDYLVGLAEDVSISAGIENHCEIVKNLAVRRRIIDQCATTMDNAFNLTRTIDETLSEHKGAIRTMNSGQGPDYKTNHELVKAVFQDIKTRAESVDHYVGVKTGFDNIDLYMNGLEPKTTNYLIARPSMGKTALAMNISDFVAANYPGNVIFFSLEGGDMALTRRRLSTHSGVFLSRLRTGDIADSQWPDLLEAASVTSENNLIIIDRPRYKTIENLIPIAETLAMDSPLSLIVIDHIQRMKSKGKFNNRHLELSFVSEELSSLANELNIPILILCQLSREIEKRRDQNPKLSDMKESGDLEANADSVWGLYRKDKEDEYAHLEGLKGRDTGTWRTWLKFDRYIQKFSDCKDPDYEALGQKTSNGIL